LIRRIEKTHRYELTDQGLRVAMFFNRNYARLLRPGLAQATDPATAGNSPLRIAFDRLQTLND
jgi:hypothetical protein